MDDSTYCHPQHPSAWVTRFAALIPPGGSVLEITCGSGRHTRHLVGRGLRVATVDRDVSGVADLIGRAEILEADLEDGGPWPFAGRLFDAVLVANYLWRPMFPQLAAWLAPGGVLIYESFIRGNERFGRPRRLDHLLAPGELLDLARPPLRLVAYEEGVTPRPNAVARLCAVKGEGLTVLPAV